MGRQEVPLMLRLAELLQVVHKVVAVAQVRQEKSQERQVKVVVLAM
jgi:hypothetical protein